MGDLPAYAKALETMVTLAEQLPVQQTLSIEPADPLSFAARLDQSLRGRDQDNRDFTWQDVWRLDDAQFSSLCSPPSPSALPQPSSSSSSSSVQARSGSVGKSDSLRSLMRSRRQSLVAPLSGTGDAQSPTPNGQDDSTARLAALKADGEPFYLREEVRAVLSLLQDHYLFEAAYSEFLTAIQCTPAAG
jgi:hypothetical protein